MNTNRYTMIGLCVMVAICLLNGMREYIVWRSLKITERELLNTIQYVTKDNKKIITPIEKPRNKIGQLSDIGILLVKNHFSITNLSGDFKGMDKQINFKATTNTEQNIIHFLYEILSKNFFIEDFSFEQIRPDYYFLEMTIKTTMDNFTKVPSFLAANFNFCSAGIKHWQDVKNPNGLLRMLGSIERDHKKQAFLLLPNEHVITIQEGEMRDDIIAIKITNRTISLKKSNHLIYLSM